MAPSSKFKEGSCLEWNTKLPGDGQGQFRLSPIFRVKGLDHHFQFSRTRNNFHLDLILCSETSSTRFIPFLVAVYAELKNGRCSNKIIEFSTIECNLNESVFDFPPYVVSRATDFFQRTITVKFLFIFDSADELTIPFFKGKVGEKSTPANLSLVQPDLEHLSADFFSLLVNEVNPDVQLHCADGVIRAHRTVLSARSKVFAAMFQTDMRENQSGDVDLKHIDLLTMRTFLMFIYSGKIQDVPVEMVSVLYSLGDKYDVPPLMRMCSDFMASNVTEGNYTEYFLMGDTYSDKYFRQSVIDYILENPKLLIGDKWLQFSSEHMDLALEVSQKFIQKTIKC